MKTLSRLLPALALTAGALHAAPVNDSINDSTELFAGPVVTASNAGATLEAGEVIPGGFTSENYTGSVWWHWKPIFSGWYEINTEDSSIGTVLSVWTSSGGSTSLVHASAGRIQFNADSNVTYKIAVAGQGTTGALSLRAFRIPDPFAKVVSASFEQTAVDVTSGATRSKATLTIEASREVSEGTFSIVAPSGLPVTSVPFSAANRVSGCVASGVYEVSFTLPRYISAGAYAWNLSVASALGKLASQGRSALSPSGESSSSTLAVVNNGVVDGYALWVAANGGGDLASLLGGTGSLSGDLGLDKYAFSPAGGALLVGTKAGAQGKKHLQVQFSRRLNSAQQGLNYQVQFSNDLVNWETSSAPGVALANDGTFESVVVEDTVATTDAPSRFARVVVERSTP